MRLGSLCSGAGSLDLAVEQVFGAETVWHCEIDDAASKVLAHRWPDVPNHRDLTTTDWSAVEPVDILTGGYPCQPFSHAGKRKGTDDERHIWPDVREAIRRLRPRYTFLENVAGHRSLGFDRVLGDLAEDGLHVRWTSVRASDVGAPHQRERLFILVTPADADDTTCCSGHSRSASASGDGQTDRIVGRCSDAANATRNGRDERWPEPAGQLRGSDAAVSGDGPVDLLPTPAACNPNDGETPETWLARRDAVKERVKNGNGMGMPLAIAVQLLPTPSAADGGGGHLTRSGERDDELLLPGIARAYGNGDLLPTPNAQDGNGGGRFNSEGHQSTLPGTVRELLPTPVARDHKGSGPSDANRNSPNLSAIDILLPTPAAADGQRGQDYARSNREGSGGDDLITAAVKAHNTNQWGKYAPAIARWEQLTRPAPNPTEPNRNGNPRLNPAFSEWMMGWPAGWVTDVPGISRNDQLRIIGNGVVVMQAVSAFQWLLNLEVAA